MTDDNLLERLNALKAPTKAPNPAVSTSTAPHPSIRPSNEGDDITTRFRRLASGDGSSPKPARQPIPSHTNLEDVVATLPSERVENVEDDQSLDELLKELGEDQSSWLQGGTEEDRISSLLKEAKAALPQQPDEHENGDLQEGATGRRSSGLVDKDLEVESEEQVRHQDEQDEQDADDYIAQIMADIELRKRQGTYNEEDSDSDWDGDHTETKRSKETSTEDVRPPARSARDPTPLDDLPSAPSTAPVLASVSDSDLEARFASLSLPSTPSNKPVTKKPASAGAKAKHNLPTYADEDIESWCVICNEDATVRCLGCEGDLYCQECWAEGHTGPDAGYDETRHKAVAYNRGEGTGKKKKSLAAA
jgi:hypothetical protein